MLISEHSERESAKQRARRIPLDYYRQRTPLDKAKWRLSWLAGIAALAYAAYVVVTVRIMEPPVRKGGIDSSTS